MAQYAFDNASALARDRFAVLQSRYDHASRDALAATGPKPGWQCLEVGAGAGSIARWLAERVGPTGRVLATDIDPGRFEGGGGVPTGLEVLRHDIVHDTLPAGPFDLIHARLVLLHLPERLAVLNRLTGALRPGGWLVLEDFDCSWTPVLACADPGQAQLFDKVHAAMLAVLTAHGAQVTWGRALFAALRDAGLEDVAASCYAEAWSGAGEAIGLHRANTEQVAAEMLAGSVTERELHAFWALLGDPQFAVQSYPMISARGRRADQPKQR